MGLGTKRICQSCAAKFYDLEKDPIKCPKCGTQFDPEVVLKPKRGRKKAAATEEVEKSDDIEIDLDDDSIEEDDEAVEEEEDLRDDIEIENDGDEQVKDEDDVLIDIDDDADNDIIDDGDTKADKE